MRDGLRIIDCDRHVIEPANMWDKYLDKRFRHYVGSIVGKEPLNRVHFFGDAVWRGAFKKAVVRDFDNVSYLADMDLEGVDVGVLFSTAGLSFCWFDDLEAELLDALCRAYNDWLHDYCSIAPDRMLGMALLPLKDVKLAERELRRAVCELGHTGIFWRPNPHFGREVSDAAYDPLFALAEELNVPIGYHEGSSGEVPPERGGGSDRFGFKWYGSNRCDTSFVRHAARHPMEQMGAFASLATAGVLDRFPKLRFGFLESGCGWLPYWLERLDALYAAPALRESYKGQHAPSEYFRRGQCFISGESEEENIPQLGRLVGEDCLMWASDYPHHDAIPYFPNTVGGIFDNEHISAGYRRKILDDNPARFYGIGVRERELVPA
jgi:predicted TIM-barrel fold metal-dependent hydrolase